MLPNIVQKFASLSKAFLLTSSEEDIWLNKYSLSGLPSKRMGSPYLAGFGSLSKLPTEIRLQIWDYFSLHIGNNWHRDIPIEGANCYKHRNERVRYLGFLRASRAIYDEASDFVYRKTTLNLRCDTSTIRPSWLSMEASGGTFRLFGNLQSALQSSFSRLPLSKFRLIYIQISPPHMMQPGTLLALWHKCLHMAELLAVMEHKSAKIEIHLWQNEEVSWHRGNRGKPLDLEGTPSNALLRYQIRYWNSPPAFAWPDFEVALSPFKRLRQFKNAQVVFSQPLQGAHDSARKLEMLLTRPQPFGTHCNPGDDTLDDEAIQRAFQDLTELMSMACHTFRDETTARVCDMKYCPSILRIEDQVGRFPITRMYGKTRNSLRIKQRNG